MSKINKTNDGKFYEEEISGNSSVNKNNNKNEEIFNDNDAEMLLINKPTKCAQHQQQQQSKLTTICKIITPRKCLTQQQVEQQRSLTQTIPTATTTKTKYIDIITTDADTIKTTANIITSAGNVKVKSYANVYYTNSTLVNKKSTRTENKYLTAQLTAVSNDRELKVNATSALKQKAAEKTLTIHGNKLCEQSQSTTTTNQCEQHTEYAKGLQSGLQLLKLAEHKAQLRAEFFSNSNLPATKLTATGKKLTGKSKVSNYLLRRLLQDKAKVSSYHNNNNKQLTGACVYFPKVQELVRKFEQQQTSKMIINTNESNSGLKPQHTQQQLQSHSPLSDEGCNLTQSPYCSSDEDNDSICTASTAIERPLQLISGKRKEKVARSASSDSALGLDVDETVATRPTEAQQSKRRMTLTVTDLPLRPALLPLAEPTALPDTCTDSPTLITPTAVPSKVLLEERVVELPAEETLNSLTSSRRESAQSCLSDYPLSECSGVRYMRTPSVVVSDYSDDVMCGITLEEIEYFRAQRNARRCSSLDTTGNEKDTEAHSDVSAASSCSNLYYCGSTISALDGAECFVNGVRVPLERKSSDSSNYSAGAESDEIAPTQETDMDICNMLAAQYLDNQSSQIKKVGRTPKVVVSHAEN